MSSVEDEDASAGKLGKAENCSSVFGNANDGSWSSMSALGSCGLRGLLIGACRVFAWLFIDSFQVSYSLFDEDELLLPRSIASGVRCDGMSEDDGKSTLSGTDCAIQSSPSSCVDSIGKAGKCPSGVVSGWASGSCKCYSGSIQVTTDGMRIHAYLPQRICFGKGPRAETAGQGLGSRRWGEGDFEVREENIPIPMKNFGSSMICLVML